MMTDSSSLEQISREVRFQSLVKQIKQCRKCEGLNVQNITESAPGFGNLHSKVMIVGQSLCRKCMETQIPFTGGSGRLLDKAFEVAHISKSDVFITNVVHCHPPENRVSLIEEITNCRGYLLKELEIIKPKVIIPLGQDAVISILGEENWSKFVGKKVAHNSYIVYPMYHPSYIMKKGRKEIQKYVIRLAEILKREIR